MSEQASLHLCNLAERVGLKRAREIVAASQNLAPVVPKTETPALTPAVPSSPDAKPEAPSAAEEPNLGDALTREQIDAGAAKATPDQLRTALDELAISYPLNAKKPELLALFLARP